MPRVIPRPQHLSYPTPSCPTFPLPVPLPTSMDKADALIKSPVAGSTLQDTSLAGVDSGLLGLVSCAWGTSACLCLHPVVLPHQALVHGAVGLLGHVVRGRHVGDAWPAFRSAQSSWHGGDPGLGWSEALGFVISSPQQIPQPHEGTFTPALQRAERTQAVS